MPSFRVVAMERLTDRDLAAWASLSDGAIDPNPYFDPRWLVPASGGATEGLVLAVVEDGDRMLALLPLRIDRLSLLDRRATTEAELFTSAAARRHPLVSPEDPVGALRTLLEGLRDSMRVTSLHLGAMPGDGPLWDALQSASHASRMPVGVHGELANPWSGSSGAVSHFAPGRVQRAEDPDYALAHWSSSSNRRTARYARGLVREIGEVALTVTDSAESCEEFLALQASGWKGDTSRGGAAYATEGTDEWFRKMTEGFRTDGRLRVFRLGTPSVPAHMYVTVACGDGLFGLADAYDEALSSFHPGTLGRVATQNAALAEAAYFDPCLHPDNAVAARQYGHVRPGLDVLVSVGRIRAWSVRLSRRLRRRSL